MTFKARKLDAITIKGGVCTDKRGNAYSASNILSFYLGPGPELGTETYIPQHVPKRHSITYLIFLPKCFGELEDEH